MQVKKTDIRQSIISASREAFLEYGFKKTSMRLISMKSGVGLSNIYNYFSNKDELLKEVLSPLINYIEERLNLYCEEEYIDISVFDMYDVNVAFMINMIKNFKEELKLLIFNSYGSSFENYKDVFIDKSTNISKIYFQKIKEKYPRIQVDISDFFIHVNSSWWWRVVEELISHDEIKEDELEVFITEFTHFSSSGWKALMGFS